MNRIYINNDWQYINKFDESMLDINYDSSNLEIIRLPHTVCETPFNYFDEGMYQMVSSYRKEFEAKEEWKNKHVFITIEAAAHESTLYINGNKVITHSCGYTAYKVDLSPYLVWDNKNVLVIKVDSNETLNQPPFGNVIDYMTYGGIYREIYLEIKNKSYIKDVFPKVSIVDDLITLTSKIDLVNNDNCIIKQELYDLDGTLIQEFKDYELIHKIDNVKLWDIDNPNLYLLKTVLFKEDVVYDERIDRIGFRSVEFRSDGFYLNDKKIKLRGLNRHQSYPYVGYAMPKSMQIDDVKTLKYKLGLNAVRTSHYPQSHHFINACDEMGLLVFTEIPGWQHIGNDEWKMKTIKNTSDMVLEYRNHPSIILWGVRINESMDDNVLYEETNNIAHKLDPTRQTSGVRFIQKSSLLEDVYAYNDFSHDGTNLGTLKKKKVTPNVNKGYLVSEYNGHMFPTKSFDCEDHRVDHMKRHAAVVDGYYSQNDVAGGFGWCMADYNTHKDFGSGDRICYHGVLDMFRNPKMASYVYSSQIDNDHVLEVSSMMDIGEHPACLAKDVYAITNADSVRLYKNDKFIKEFKNTPYKNMPHGPILIDDFIGDIMEKEEGFSHKKAEDIKKILLATNKYGLAHLPFNIIMLAAKCILFRGVKMSDAVTLYNKYIGNWGGTYTTYKFEAIKDGKVVKTQIRKPVKDVYLDVEVSHTNLKEDTTYDVAAIRVRAVDDNGVLLPYYQEPVVLKVSGPIELIGPNIVTLKGGSSGTYVKTTGEKGIAKISIGRNNKEEKVIEFNIN